MTHLALTFARWTANRFSIESLSAAGGRLGRRFGPGTKRHARALRNIERALPATSVARREEIAGEMWDNFGRTVAESLVIDRIAADPKRVQLENPEVLAEANASKRGTVFVGLHFGNWEATAIPGLHLKLGLVGVYKPLKDARVNAWLLSQRGALYPGGLLAGNPATLLTLTRHIKRGGSMCLLADHRDPRGLAVPFFDMPAPSVALPALLAVRYGARLIAARVDRLEGSRFSVYLETIAVPGTGNEATDVHDATANIQNMFAGWILADPGKWLWFYKRWGDTD